MARKSVFAVLGAGNSGFGLAADLAFRGFDIRLFELPQFSAALKPVVDAGGIKIRGIRGQGLAKIALTTTDAEEAIRGADAILCSVPAYAHRSMARVIAPYLRDGDMVVLMPGCTGGAIEVMQTVREMGNSASFIVAEASSFIFACKKDGPDGVWIRGLKQGLPLAALPAKATRRVLERIGAAYPEFAPARNVMDTSLNNVNHPSHPTATLLNVGRIEAMGGDWSFHHEGMTPSVCRLTEAVDKERLAVVAAYGLPQKSLLEMLIEYYGHQGFGGKDLYEAVSTTPVHGAARAPSSVNHRYLTEDVPYGIVPISSFGRVAGVDVPLLEGLATVTGAVAGRDFWTEGRTVESLGLAGKSVSEILDYVEEG